MAPQTSTTTFPDGFVLVRHYDDIYGSVDAQCGDLALWQSYIDQLDHDSQEYYIYSGARNKFDEKVEINAYSRFLPFPDPQGTGAVALTYALGANKSRIDIQFFDPNGETWNRQVWVPNTYRFPAALSHEMGHANSNWAGFYGDASASTLQEVARAWEKMISSNHTAYTPGVFPWTNDKPFEQFANTYRAIFGTYLAPGNTRGSSNNQRDPVIAGFEDPLAHPSWKQAIQYMPELCAFVLSYGATTDTMQWYGDYCWYFKTAKAIPGYTSGPTWVFQSYYYTIDGRSDGWFFYNGSDWVRFKPSYVRS